MYRPRAREARWLNWNLCVILHASLTLTSPFTVVVVVVVPIRPIKVTVRGGFVRECKRRSGVARSLTESNFAPAMMHDAR